MQQQQQLDELKAEVTRRIYERFLEKFNGNQREFARAAGCDEKAIRLLFQEKQGMTLNLLFKVSAALGVEASELLNGLTIKRSIN